MVSFKWKGARHGWQTLSRPANTATCESPTRVPCRTAQVTCLPSSGNQNGCGHKAGLGYRTKRPQLINVKSLMAVSKEHLNRGFKIIHLVTQIERTNCNLQGNAVNGRIESLLEPSTKATALAPCSETPRTMPGTDMPRGQHAKAQHSRCVQDRAGNMPPVFRATRVAAGTKQAWDTARRDRKLSRCLT